MDRERHRSLSDLHVRAHWAQPVPRWSMRVPLRPRVLPASSSPQRFKGFESTGTRCLCTGSAREGRLRRGTAGRRFESGERAGHSMGIRTHVSAKGGSSRATAERKRWPLSTCDGRTSSALARRGEARVRGRGGTREACSSTPSVTCTGAAHKARRGGKPAAARARARARAGVGSAPVRRVSAPAQTSG